LLPAGAIAGWDFHPLESAAFARRTPKAVIHQRAAFERRCRKNFLVAASTHPGFLPHSSIDTLCFDKLG
jgi:hypothetical protein